MDFRRLPFQFSTTNPVDRQSELLRRFGIPPEEKMFTETSPTPIADALSRLSPRSQHRIPGFLSNEDHPRELIRQRHAENVDSPKAEPKVRIVPIQIEGDSVNPSRHCARSEETSASIKTPGSSADEEHTREKVNSGSQVPLFKSHKINSPFFSNRPSFLQRDPKERVSEVGAPQTEAKVCNIPIHCEDQPSTKGTKLSHSKTVPLQKETSKRGATNMGNGPCVSKSATEPSTTNMKDDKRQKTDVTVSLKQIELILKEFKSFEEGVNEFSGIQIDKRYRYLDEMLTRCMLKLDDIETFGNEEVRKARKAAVKRVQDTINDLDSKVQHKPEENKQISNKVEDPVIEEKASQKETTVEDVAMGEDYAQNQSLKDFIDQSQNMPCSENGDVLENRPDLNEASDNKMEVEAPENTAVKNIEWNATRFVSENVVSSEGTAPSECAEKLNVEIVQNESQKIHPIKADLCTNSDSLKDDALLPCMNGTSIKENSEHCSNLTNGELSSNSEEIASNLETEGCANTKDANLKNDCVRNVSFTSEQGVVVDVDMKDLERDASVKSQDIHSDL